MARQRSANQGVRKQAPGGPQGSAGPSNLIPGMQLAGQRPGQQQPQQQQAPQQQPQQPQSSQQQQQQQQRVIKRNSTSPEEEVRPLPASVFVDLMSYQNSMVNCPITRAHPQTGNACGVLLSAWIKYPLSDILINRSSKRHNR